jgi:hypothetical protein
MALAAHLKFDPCTVTDPEVGLLIAAEAAGLAELKDALRC